MANPFTDSANQVGATGVGLADLWAQIVGQSEQDALARIQQLGLAPPESLGQGAQQGADILSARNAQIPAQSLGQTGSAWDQFMGAAPGYIQGITDFEGQLQQQQLAQNAQMNALSQQASAAGSGGGSSEGLTPYQYFQVQADMADRAYRQEQDALDREFELAKYETEQGERSQEDQAFAGIMSFVLQDAGFSPKEIKKLLPGLVGAGSSGLSAISGIAGDRQDAADDAADDAKAAAVARQERRQELRETIAGFDLGDFPNKNAATQALSNEIETLYPNLAGLNQGRVNALIRNRVNSGWAGRGGSTGGGSSTVGADNWSGVGKLMNSYWKDIKDIKATETVTDSFSGEQTTKEVTRRVSYKTAFARMYGRVADEYRLPNGRWKKGLNEQKVKKRVHTFLRRQGLKRPPRSAPPVVSGTGL